ncbi:MAG TPA: tetratricopeptide repeat protein [Gemmatimonadales bacterium]|jgi:tetratricopeptide (TPR) repeat protein
MNRPLLVFLALCIAPPTTQAYGQELPFLNRSIKDLEAWVREDTNDAQRQYFLALAHWKHFDWPQTDSLLRLAIQLDPRYADAYLALGFLPYARRTSLADEAIHHSVPKAWQPLLDEAEGFYKRAFRTDPLVTLQVMSIVNGVEEPQVSDFTPSGWVAYQRCCAWYVDLGLGRYRLASDRLTKLAQREFDEAKHPDRVPDYIHWYRGLAAAHSLRYSAAIADFRVLLDRTVQKTQRDEIVHVPLRDNEYRFILATLHHLAGHNDSAIALYQESLEHDLGLTMAHTSLASIYDEMGRPADAMLERQRATEVSTDDPTALFELGVSLFNTGQTVAADEPLRRAIALNPRFSPPYYLLGRVTEELGLPEEAREHYARFLALAPLRLENLRSDVQQRVARLAKP